MNARLVMGPFTANMEVDKFERYVYVCVPERLPVATLLPWSEPEVIQAKNLAFELECRLSAYEAQYKFIKYGPL